MNAESLQAAATSLMAVIGILYVLSHQHRRTAVQWLLVWVLLFVAIWTAGLALRFTALTDAEARFGLTVTYLGAQGLGPAWLLFALRFTGSRLEDRPGLKVALCAPGAVFFLALLTNDGHRMIARSLAAEDLAQGPMVWAGPLFWIALVWSFVVVLAGVGAFAHYARRLYAQRGRMQGVTLVIAGTIPTIAIAVHYTELIRFPADPAPLATGIVVGIAFYMTLRYRLLDIVPIARRDVIDQLSDGVIIADAEGSIVDLNPRAEELLGRDSSEVLHGSLSRSLGRLAPAKEGAALVQSLERVARGEPLAVIVHGAGGRDLQLDVGCVRDRNEEPTGLYALLRDVTETKRYERLIRESQQRAVVGGLAAGLAHELNNPLSFVASNLQQIHRAVSASPEELDGLPPKRAAELRELSEVVEETIEGVDRIAQIVGRIVRPRHVAEEQIERLDLGDVVREAVRLAEFHHPYAMPVIVGVVDGLPEVEASGERLSQALLTVLLSAQALAAATSGSSVRLDARIEGSAVALRFALAPGDPGASPAEGCARPPDEAELSTAYETLRELGGALESGDDGSGVLHVVRLPAQPSLAGQAFVD